MSFMNGFFLKTNCLKGLQLEDEDHTISLYNSELQVSFSVPKLMLNSELKIPTIMNILIGLGLYRQYVDIIYRRYTVETFSINIVIEILSIVSVRQIIIGVKNR